MSKGLDWNRARQDAQMRDTAAPPQMGRGQRPTAKQLDYLDTLAGQCGEKAPQALNRQHASQLIAAYRRKLNEPM